MILHYSSTFALAQEAKRLGVTRDDRDNSWYGGENSAETYRKSEVGDTRLVSVAEALLSRLDAGVETPRRTWAPSPAGAFCIVPEVLAGIPTSMRRQVYVPDERAPITVLVTTTCSAGISAEVMAKRGTVILALVLALSRVRPITLKQLAMTHGEDTGETIITSDINTTPLDLASACYVLTSVGFARRLTYGIAKKLNGFNGYWPTRYHERDYCENLVLRLGFAPKFTLLIREAYLHDTMLTRPVEWVQSQIDRFTQTSEED